MFVAKHKHGKSWGRGIQNHLLLDCFQTQVIALMVDHPIFTSVTMSTQRMDWDNITISCLILALLVPERNDWPGNSGVDSVTKRQSCSWKSTSVSSSSILMSCGGGWRHGGCDWTPWVATVHVSQHNTKHWVRLGASKASKQATGDLHAPCILWCHHGLMFCSTHARAHSHTHTKYITTHWSHIPIVLGGFSKCGKAYIRFPNAFFVILHCSLFLIFEGYKYKFTVDRVNDSKNIKLHKGINIFLYIYLNIYHLKNVSK